MNLNPAWLNRYLARVDELEALRLKLEAQQPTGELAPIAGRVLEAAGDLLRRSQRVPHDGAAVDRALALLSPAALLSWEQGVSLAGLAQRLVRAADEAVEAALPDASDDGHAFAAWALEGLAARDRLESALAALLRLQALGRKDAGALLSRLAPPLEQLDARGRRAARALTPLNPARREEVAALDADARGRAWWYGAMDAREHDGLVRALGGEGEPPTGQAERAVGAALEQRHRRAVTVDELFRYDLGLASPAEIETIRRQAAADPELARALAAMADAELAIAELEGPAGAPEVAPPPAPREGPSVRVLDDGREATVLLMRRSQRLFLVVQPRAQGLAAAAVFLPDAPARARPMRRRSEGFELELGAEDGLRGAQVRLVLRAASGAERALELVLP